MAIKKIIKVILIILAIILVLGIALVTVTYIIFGTQLNAANSVKKVDEGLYTMEYEGDYGFDAFLEQGGASTDAEMGEYITEFLTHGLIKADSKEIEKNFGCSTLSVKNSEGAAMLGRNYDWDKCDAMIVHTKPNNGYESVSTCCLNFLGFDSDWKPEGMQNKFMSLAAVYVPLDGINEKGLCIADLMAGDDEQTHQDTEKTDLTVTAAIRLVLDKAATVDEAVALLKKYDMNSSIGKAHHFAITDATGRSVVVEYVDNEMVTTETYVVTNHYLSKGEKYGIGNEESHNRFETLTQIRKDANGLMTAQELCNSMESVSYNTTQWTIVYDTKTLTADYYWQRQFNKPYRYVLGK